MPIGDGRGDAKRRRIRETWELIPVLHTRLLNGQQIQCCCGDPVTSTYYRFDAKHRITGKQDVLLAHDDGCAKKLLEIAPAIDPIPLFDPLQAAAARRPRRGAAGNGGHGPAMDAFNVELYDAIHLLLMCWGRPPTSGGPLSTILAEIRRAPDRPRPDRDAKSVNSVIKSGKRTLTAMLQALPPQHPPMRHFDFPHMREALLKHPDKPDIWL